jgi:hypothetical protein
MKIDLIIQSAITMKITILNYFKVIKQSISLFNHIFNLKSHSKSTQSDKIAYTVNLSPYLINFLFKSLKTTPAKTVPKKLALNSTLV